MTIYCPLSEALGLPQPEKPIKYTDYSYENYDTIPGIRKGILHTNDTKRLMSERRQKYLENNPGPMSGKKHSEETRQRMKEKRLKYLETDEGKQQFNLWQDSSRKSQKRSEAARQQCLVMNKDPEKIRKTADKNRGQKRSLESRVKMSEARKRYYQTLKNGE